MNGLMRTASLTDIGNQTLEHLAAEQHGLQAILDCIERIRTALLARDDASLEDALRNMPPLQERQSELRQVRERLQAESAALLNIQPETLTLSLFIKRLPAELAQSLTERQQALRSLVREVNRLNHGNMMLISTSVKLTRDVMEVLTGKPIAQRYGKDGQLNDQESLTFFQTEL
jgi:flagellar biosynthesis/type III secretory pathway chaperone